MKVLKLVAIALALVSLSTAGAAKAQDPILVQSKGETQDTIRAYNRSGAAMFEVLINKSDLNQMIFGRWSTRAPIAAISGDEKSRKVKFINEDSSLRSEISLPAEAINTIISADYNNNGYSDLIAIVHVGTKAKAFVYLDPGMAASQPLTINLALQATYYAPAIAGKSTVGILAYKPAGATNARLRKGAGKKNKQPKAGKGASVFYLDLQGGIVKNFNIPKGPDTQVYSFSSDGACGFAMMDGQKLKAYNSSGSLIKELAVPSGSGQSIGNFSNGANLEEIILTEGKSLKLVNLSSGAESSITLSGLPNQKELVEAQIKALGDELLNAYKNNLSITEINAIREKILALNSKRDSIGNATNVASRLVRLFSGGAGSIEGVCDVVDETPNDGYGGFLVKNGDYSGTIVILTPGGNNYQNAELLKFGTYKAFQKLKDGGYGNPDSNGVRKHFRGKGTVQSLGKFIFRAKLKMGYEGPVQNHCWYITNPSSRID